jgi:hypothetical protein
VAKKIFPGLPGKVSPNMVFIYFLAIFNAHKSTLQFILIRVDGITSHAGLIKIYGAIRNLGFIFLADVNYILQDKKSKYSKHPIPWQSIF